LLALEIPKDSIVKYETALQTAEILLITHETAAEVYKTSSRVRTLHLPEAVAA
jgi:hypothetical protein